MAHPGLPETDALILDKAKLLRDIVSVENDPAAKSRAKDMEVEFKKRITSSFGNLPTASAKFSKFSTSPFVLMFYALQQEMERISQIESAIVPAKVFSSMETSAGRMVETIALPQYGWQPLPSSMHSQNSAIDGFKLEKGVLKLATLKSGPRCLNDEMSENFADSILANCVGWAKDHDVSKIEFTYGVLYGTQSKSNKKDWHILRNIAEKHPTGLEVAPWNRWDCGFKKDGVEVSVTVRIGLDWWRYLGGDLAFAELAIALLRSCVKAGSLDPAGHKYTISDLANIVSTGGIPTEFNPDLIQSSQLPWLFFLAAHFCDALITGDLSTLPPTS